MSREAELVQNVEVTFKDFQVVYKDQADFSDSPPNRNEILLVVQVIALLHLTLERIPIHSVASYAFSGNVSRF